MRTLAKLFLVLPGVAASHRLFAREGKIVPVGDGDLMVALHADREVRSRRHIHCGGDLARGPFS